jgi:hypothetical protein
MPVNYANSKIYSIQSYQRPDLVYIGSTTQSLSRRLAKHRSNYKWYKNGNGNNVTSYDIFDACTDAYIELIESVECLSKEELHRREGYWIKGTVCVNKVIPGQTTQEYRQVNKVKIVAYKKKYHQEHRIEKKHHDAQYRQDNAADIAVKLKKYYQLNKGVIAQRRKQLNKQRIECMCGSTITHGAKARHLRTQKHHMGYQTVIHDFIHS